MKVVIVFGSLSDKAVMGKAARVLEAFDVPYGAFAISAHRLPAVLEDKLKDWEAQGVELIIAGAGLAAHLPGVIASKTILPVIGIPLKGAIEGLDALYSIVQMPKGVPVATVGIDNAHNAAFLAVQILALKHAELKVKLERYRAEQVEQLTKEVNQIL